ncbi:MAG: hypothetical protein ACOYJX_02155 [Acutalibacteraceae bacterium]|jgi:hypothetical protein
MLKNLREKSKVELFLFFAFVITAILSFCVFILSFVYSDAFPYGVHSESIGLTILAALLSIEIFLFKKSKRICLATTWLYVLATLLLRFFANVQLITTPVITWTSIILLTVLGILIAVTMKK